MVQKDKNYLISNNLRPVCPLGGNGLSIVRMYSHPIISLSIVKPYYLLQQLT